MIKTYKTKRVQERFVFEYRKIKYFIDIQKLKRILGILRIKIKEEDILTNKSFNLFLKEHGLLIKEFVEYISKS